VGHVLQDTIIRAFDGSLADAEGLLAVERATFDELPYSAEQVRAMLTGGAHCAWLALGKGRVVGFVAAFPITGLHGTCWDIDLLAVDPGWTGRGLATGLIQAAATHGTVVACQARAVVAADNFASARAFARAGFRRAQACQLLMQRLQGRSLHPWTTLGVSVHEATSIAEAMPWLPGESISLASDQPVSPQEWPERGRLTFLLAECYGRPAGYAELVEVQTLLYRGVWIESLAASDQMVQAALVHKAVNQAITAGLDEISMMVPERDRSLQDTLLATGFRSLGDFDWFTSALPLPALTS